MHYSVSPVFYLGLVQESTVVVLREHRHALVLGGSILAIYNDTVGSLVTDENALISC